MTLTRIYHIEALGNLVPEYGHIVFGGVVVDSITNKLAGGVSVTGGFLDSFQDPATSLDRSWLDVRLALAYPIVDAFSVGLGGRYIKVTQNGTGWLEPVDQLAGRVHLAGVTAGTPIVVRMNYFPAWRAAAGSQPILLRSQDGQVAFDAPASGDYVVDLTYPARRGLLVLGLTIWCCGAAVLGRW